MNCCQWPTANDPMVMPKADDNNPIQMPPTKMAQWQCPAPMPVVTMHWPNAAANPDGLFDYLIS